MDSPAFSSRLVASPPKQGPSGGSRWLRHRPGMSTGSRSCGVILVYNAQCFSFVMRAHSMRQDVESKFDLHYILGYAALLVLVKETHRVMLVMVWYVFPLVALFALWDYLEHCYALTTGNPDQNF